VSLIPKRDPGITNFSIPDPGIENSIPGLQSLLYIPSFYLQPARIGICRIKMGPKMFLKKLSAKEEYRRTDMRRG